MRSTSGKEVSKMRFDISEINIIAVSADELKAAELFAGEIEARCGKRPAAVNACDDAAVRFVCDGTGTEDYSLECGEKEITVTAHRLRGLIYGFFHILRKSVCADGRIILNKNISGSYSPAMRVRGHNVSYTESNNACDAWSKEQYRRYLLDLMAFGLNIAEDSYCINHQRNALMKMSFREALQAISEICLELDLEMTLYYPLDKKFTDEETVGTLLDDIKGLPVLSHLFLPGGDPGNLQAEDFVKRCRAIKHAVSELYPEAEIIPSAQAPHEYPDWGERFKKAMADEPDEFQTVIFGPNHAMPLDELRRSISLKYSIDQYPDITHNVRCETPVHFTRDDWHYAWAATLSRESVNPRPREYRLLHMKTRQYLRGSIPYSEGVNDDINKVLWSAMDFDFGAQPREVIRDYARLFIPQADPDEFADLIFGLEQNWEAPPEENFSVEAVFRGFEKMLNGCPELYENWRFLLHYFRALCDKIVRDRRIFELGLIEKASCEIRYGSLDTAKNILSAEFSDEYKKFRAELFALAEKLFGQIGIQLDVEHFGGKNWERGCTLETIDMPITDRTYLLNKLASGADRDEMISLLDRCKTDKDEYYFSVAEHGLAVSGSQDGEFYMDFKGDRNPDAARPMCLVNGFDHFNFRLSAAGLTGGDYILRITYGADDNNEGTHLRLAVNGHTVYEGERFGGRRDEEYEKKYLPDGYICVAYDIPAEILENGCALLEMTEPIIGFIIYELSFRKK